MNLCHFFVSVIIFVLHACVRRIGHHFVLLDWFFNFCLSPAIKSAGATCLSKRDVWASLRFKRKDAAHSASMKEHYQEFISSNELIRLSSALKSGGHKDCLSVDAKTRKLFRVIRDTMEESLKTRILAQRSNTMWDILLDSEELAKMLTGNIMTKLVRMKTKRPKWCAHGHFRWPSRGFYLPVWNH